MQWQHGKYYLPGNGSIYLQPIQVDGRQQMSTPCQYENSVYERYYQPEFIKSYGIEVDGFHNIQRLNLFLFDGSPQQPLYLAYSPPQMLPTQTLNPTATASATSKAAKIKRDEDPQVLLQMGEPLNRNAIIQPKKSLVEPDQFWYAGIGLILIGGVMFMYPTSKKP
ncbi:hypothetical protein BT93_L4389 [Corymbia citriodora subsp. variegata]|uniref:Protein ROT1 n=1 Tax=Corymbia citriodora subsp. variegata TaxID=360336 RepID=A0A8T0CH06_CORYI|nr:hypothetical protein BT93_L4389 [Corymbia citriodora subsp. variegata]